MKKFTELCKKLGTVFFRFPILSALLGCILLPMTVYFIASEILFSVTGNWLELDGSDNFWEGLPFSFGFSLFIIFPLALTLLNLMFLIFRFKNENAPRAEAKTETTTFVLGTVYSLLYLLATNITFSPWYEQLYNAQLHSPVAPERVPVIVIIAVATVFSYIWLRTAKPSLWPPLTGAIAVGAVYLGMALCAVWAVQISKHEPLLALLPLNFIILAFKRIVRLVQAERCGDGMLRRTADWPWMGILAAAGLLALYIVFSRLFGGRPDDIVKVWTETADWTLSQKIAPPNLSYDEHYLCTLAAQGHKRIVKPLRPGKRHGHTVIVNRQLCVANAFEQLLEERTPRFHRLVRGLYDKYGLPVARLINKQWKADIVYFIMKPAEYFFLAVLYLFDCDPEKRISVQYPWE